jgi:hypothetical protein
MNMLRRASVSVGLFLILLAAYGAWRSANLVQSDTEQIRSVLDAAASGLKDRAASRITGNLTPDFKWGETSRSEFNQILSGALWQARDIDLVRTNEQIEVRGDTATSTGKYRASYRPAPEAGVETNSGNYSVTLRKIDGDWKIQSLRGGENIGP